MHHKACGREVRNQSTDEWLADYSGCSPDEYRKAKGVHSEHRAVSSVDITPNEIRWRYVEHRTTKKGSVALDFESLDGRFKATRFFNVSLKSNRGKSYPSGYRGQFSPPKDGLFRDLWMMCVGKMPTRWCTVHKSLRNNFKDVVFVGSPSMAYDRNGNLYYKLLDVKPLT